MSWLVRFLLTVSILAGALLSLVGCDQGRTPEQVAAQSISRPYIETGDLEAIKKRQVLRLLAPRQYEDDALPREGFPMVEYRRMAEDFARWLELTPQWIFVDDYSQLVEYLNAGKGDVIATNMTRTDGREEHVAFAGPLAFVDEILLVPEALSGKAVSDLGQIEVAVPKGMAWEESLEQLMAREGNIQVQQVAADTSNWALVEGVASGLYQATLMDSDVATALVAIIPGVAFGPVITQNREIGWGVRTANPQLKKSLSEFLVASRVFSTRRVKEKRDWAEIKKAGVLRVITSNNPASYFLWRGELMGFDYDLIREFARQHGLRVSVIVRDGTASMRRALDEGYGDLIAAAVTRTPAREEKGWVFSRRYLEVTEQIVGPAKAAAFDTTEQLAGRHIAVNPEHSYFDSLKALQQAGLNIELIEVPDTTSELLMNAVASGKYPFTIADSHLVAMESTFRDDLKAVLDLGETKEIGYVVRPEQKQLLDQLNRFVRSTYRGTFYNITWQKYFAEPKHISRYRAQRIEAGKPISPFDDLVKEKAAGRSMDWRLLVSQMYQESRFNPEAISPAGAQGLMQVMPRTAHQFGYSNLLEPEENLEASLDFIFWLGERFPASLPLEERIYFMLAAYNAGHGHVQDARTLARRLGKDPNKWFGNVETAMLLLSRPEYYRNARYGYVRGSEPVAYVREISERYMGYVRVRAGEP